MATKKPALKTSHKKPAKKAAPKKAPAKAKPKAPAPVAPNYYGGAA